MKQKHNKFKYICYPFMRESNWFVDYELQTDGLSSEFGHAYSLSNNSKDKKILKQLSRISLDLNPLVRLPNDKILESLHQELDKIYNHYFCEFSTFYLPIGKPYETYLSTIRKTTKIIIRTLVKNNFKNTKLIDAFEIMCNIIHLIYIKNNEDLIPFKSRSYK